ncbi:MAG: flagellar basal-body rod protein FlgF [Terracidiphilus sp.]|jgi:flagellar basal-body rod protein FlgF/flagellar basal-body rod protein FlgG
MSSGYYAACAGLMTRTDALDTIANNLANVSTPGFRASHNSFSAVLETANDEPLSALNQDANEYGYLGGTHLDTAQGALVPTGNQLDLAIDGSGYFAVQTAAGTAYTRGGNFRVSPQGQLITSAGDPVLGDGGPISIVGEPVSISTDGTISVNGAISGKLKLTDFPAGTQLESLGNSYYKAPQGVEVAATNAKVHQGQLESSNVNPITSVVELITAQHEVESMRRTLSLFSDEMDKTAAQDLPRVS